VIVLDTNVLSELARQSPDQGVLGWLDSIPPVEFATTAITAAELWAGVMRLPEGRRKAELTEVVDVLLNKDLRGRVESFDIEAASSYALIVSDREKSGRPIGTADAQIAAICRTRRATLATRNIKDFLDTGVELIDPWRFG
jgi:predicted nucleic acid-binding protein